MCLLKDFISVFALNTPIKVLIENMLIYGRCYDDADHDTTFKVFSIDELLDKYGDYIVNFTSIRHGIIHIDIEKELI